VAREMMKAETVKYVAELSSVPVVIFIVEEKMKR